MSKVNSTLQLKIFGDLLNEKGKLYSPAEILIPAESVMTLRTDLWVSQTMDLICQKQIYSHNSLFSWEMQTGSDLTRGLPKILALIKTPFELQAERLEKIINWWAHLQGRQSEYQEILAHVNSLSLKRYLSTPWSELSPRVRFLAFICSFINADPLSIVFIPGATFLASDWQTIEQSLTFLARIINTRIIIVREDEHPTQFTEYYLNSEKLKQRSIKNFDSRLKTDLATEQEDEDEMAS